MLAKQEKIKKLLFKISKPYGYYMEEVEEAIHKYDDILKEMENIIAQQQLKISELESENKRLNREVTDMHMQMSMLEIPDSNAITEQVIINQFREKTGIIKISKPSKDINFEIEGAEVSTDSEENMIKEEGDFLDTISKINKGNSSGNKQIDIVD